MFTSVFRYSSLWCISAILAVSSPVFPQSGPHYNIEIKGTVYKDKGNRTSLQKTSGPVAVSNGDTIVYTDKKGQFRLFAKEGDVIFPILPNGFTTKDKAWWLPVTRTTTSYSFVLSPVPVKKKFRMLAIGDVQIADSTEMLYAAKSVIHEVTNRQDYDLSLYLGDLVNDTPTLFPPLKTMLEDSIMYRTVYGNHDRNFRAAAEQQTDSYRNNFGPDTYAFYKNNVLFITLNSITPSGKYGYKRLYSERQFRFLEQLLRNANTRTPIVISQHIPLVGMINKDRIYRVLDRFRHILVLSAHTHTIFQQRTNTPSGHTIHEINAGASCGNWWTGQVDWEGIPTALMQCGAPRGYFEIDFENSDYTLRYKGVGLDRSKQTSLWVSDYEGTPTGFLNTSREIFLNVFSGSARTQIDIRLPDGTIIPMTKVKRTDPFVHYLRKSQKKGMAPDLQSKAAPYLNRNSAHLWKARLPEDLKPGAHRLQFFIRDPRQTAFREVYWIWSK